MVPTPWTSPAVSRVHDQPPTLVGLTYALAAADEAARSLAEGADDHSRPPARAVLDACRAASGCLDPVGLPSPAPAIDPPGERGDPRRLRELEPVLTACIELAVDVLDNEDEPLDVSQVTAIGQAVGHLDTARWHCWEAEQ